MDMRQQIISALTLAGEEAERARLMRAAAIAKIGEILRRDRAAGDLVGVVAAEEITGLSRPTLTRARKDEAGWQELVELAALALTDRPDAEAELHRRQPVQAMWQVAATHVAGEAAQREWEESGVGPAGASLDVPVEADWLTERHESWLRRLAAGVPAGIDWADGDRIAADG